MLSSTFIENSKKRIGGKFNDIKEIFSLVDDQTNEKYSVKSVFDLMDVELKEILYSKKEIDSNSYPILVSTINNKLELRANNLLLYTSNSSTNILYIVNIIKEQNILHSTLLYIDESIGNENNTYNENNVISCNYGNRVYLSNDNNLGIVDVEVISLPLYTTIKRYKVLNSDKIINNNFSNIPDDNSYLYVDKSENILGIISDNNSTNSVEVELSEDSEFALSLVGNNLEKNNSDIYVNIDGSIKPIIIENQFDYSKNISLLKDLTNVKGNLKISLFNTNELVVKISLYIDNKFIEVKDIKFVNKNIPNLQVKDELSNYHYGFAICINDCLDLSIYTNKNEKDILIFDKIEIDYSELNREIRLEEKLFSTLKSIPLRKGYKNYDSDMLENYKIELDLPDVKVLDINDISDDEIVEIKTISASTRFITPKDFGLSKRKFEFANSIKYDVVTKEDCDTIVSSNADLNINSIGNIHTTMASINGMYNCAFYRCGVSVNDFMKLFRCTNSGYHLLYGKCYFDNVNKLYDNFVKSNFTLTNTYTSGTIHIGAYSNYICWGTDNSLSSNSGAYYNIAFIVEDSNGKVVEDKSYIMLSPVSNTSFTEPDTEFIRENFPSYKPFISSNREIYKSIDINSGEKLKVYYVYYSTTLYIKNIASMIERYDIIQEHDFGRNIKVDKFDNAYYSLFANNCSSYSNYVYYRYSMSVVDFIRGYRYNNKGSRPSYSDKLTNRRFFKNTYEFYRLVYSKFNRIEKIDILKEQTLTINIINGLFSYKIGSSNSTDINEDMLCLFVFDEFGNTIEKYSKVFHRNTQTSSGLITSASIKEMENKFPSFKFFNNIDESSIETIMLSDGYRIEMYTISNQFDDLILESREHNTYGASISLDEIRKHYNFGSVTNYFNLSYSNYLPYNLLSRYGITHNSNLRCSMDFIDYMYYLVYLENGNYQYIYNRQIFSDPNILGAHIRKNYSFQAFYKNIKRLYFGTNGGYFYVKTDKSNTNQISSPYNAFIIVEDSEGNVIANKSKVLLRSNTSTSYYSNTNNIGDGSVIFGSFYELNDSNDLTQYIDLSDGEVVKIFYYNYSSNIPIYYYYFIKSENVPSSNTSMKIGYEAGLVDYDKYNGTLDDSTNISFSNVYRTDSIKNGFLNINNYSNYTKCPINMLYLLTTYSNNGDVYRHGKVFETDINKFLQSFSLLGKYNYSIGIMCYSSYTYLFSLNNTNYTNYSDISSISNSTTIFLVKDSSGKIIENKSFILLFNNSSNNDVSYFMANNNNKIKYINNSNYTNIPHIKLEQGETVSIFYQGYTSTYSFTVSTRWNSFIHGTYLDLYTRLLQNNGITANTTDNGRFSLSFKDYINFVKADDKNNRYDDIDEFMRDLEAAFTQRISFSKTDDYKEVVYNYGIPSLVKKNDNSILTYNQEIMACIVKNRTTGVIDENKSKMLLSKTKSLYNEPVYYKKLKDMFNSFKSANTSYYTVSVREAISIFDSRDEVDALIRLYKIGKRNYVEFRISNANNRITITDVKSDYSDIDYYKGDVYGTLGVAVYTDGFEIGLSVRDRTYTDYIEVTPLNIDINPIVIRNRPAADEGLIRIIDSNKIEIREFIEDNLPVGSIIHLYKFQNQINSRIKKNYLKMDGSLIPYKKEYEKLIRLFGGRYVDTNKYKVYRPKNGRVVWFMRYKSIKEYIDESEFNDGYTINGTETVTLNERYWNGYSFNNVSGNIIGTCNSLLGTSDRAVANGNAVCTMVNTTLMNAGNYYYSQYSSGLTTPSFSINDKISVGYCQISGNNCLFTIYNHTTNQYLISGTSSSNTYENFEFYQRNYDSILINGYISNGQRVFIGFGSSTSSDSTMVGDDQDKSSYVNYSFHNNFYLPDMTEEGIFLGGGDMAGTFVDASAPNIYGNFPNGNEHNNYTPTGAFYKLSHTNTTAWDGTSNPNSIGMDASRCSSIYGRSGNNLYPDHRIVEFWIKYK